MTRKDENKILDNKIESNINQYKVDRLNAEISAFSSGDLNKYEFLLRKDLKYKPNALDEARFEFSPLVKAFNTGLHKTVQGCKEEGVIKLLMDIRGCLAGGIGPPGPPEPHRPGRPPGPPGLPGRLDRPDDNDEDNNDDDNNDNIPDLETEEEAAKRIADSYEQKKDHYDNVIKNLKNKINKLKDLDAKIKDSEL